MTVSVNWVTGKIANINFWKNRLFSLIIHAPIRPFIAGQFTKLGLEINGKYIYRAYSYVNAPDNPNLEFYLVSLLEGELSRHLAFMKPGDQIQVAEEANGFFVLNEVPDCETLWMIATGTAIGPYLSILEYGKDLERFKNIVLVHAVRYATDLNYLPKMLTFKERYKGKLRIQTVVSREIISGSLTGRIQTLIENRILENKIGLSINNKTSHVMLCGNPYMIKDTQQLLKDSRQMVKHLRRRPGHITTEHYW